MFYLYPAVLGETSYLIDLELSRMNATPRG